MRGVLELTSRSLLQEAVVHSVLVGGGRCCPTWGDLVGGRATNPRKLLLFPRPISPCRISLLSPDLKPLEGSPNCQESILELPSSLSVLEPTSHAPSTPLTWASTPALRSGRGAFKRLIKKPRFVLETLWAYTSQTSFESNRKTWPAKSLSKNSWTCFSLTSPRQSASWMEIALICL